MGLAATPETKQEEDMAMKTLNYYYSGARGRRERGVGGWGGREGGREGAFSSLCL